MARAVQRSEGAGRRMVTSPQPATGQPGVVVGGGRSVGVCAPANAASDRPGLAVTGELPAELNGSYVCHGPGPVPGPLRGDFRRDAGYGIVHRIAIGEGRAHYSHRYLGATSNPGGAQDPTTGGGITPTFPLDPTRARPLSDRWMHDVPDVNIVRHGGRLLVLTESRAPCRLGPALETLGADSSDENLPAGITTHPKIDPITGEMFLFRAALEPPFLTWTVVRPDGSASQPVPVEGVSRASVIHDMALSASFVVLVVAPLFFDLRAASRGRIKLSWEPETGTRIALVPRTGGPVRWTEDAAFWLWHTANAVERPDVRAGDPVVLDYVQWDRPGRPGRGRPVAPALWRATIDPAAGTLRREQLDDASVELPRIDDRRMTRSHGVIAMTGSSGSSPGVGGTTDTHVWFDSRGSAAVRWVSPDWVLGELCFAVSSTDAVDGGWWLSVGRDVRTGVSWLLVFAAADPAVGPVARVRMPVVLPSGRHGSWLPAKR